MTAAIITTGVVGAMFAFKGALFNGLMRLLIHLVSFVLGFIFDFCSTLLGDIYLPNFTEYAVYIHNFWDLCFQFVGYIRSIFLIDSMSMYLIFLIFLIRFVYKPALMVLHVFYNDIRG